MIDPVKVEQSLHSIGISTKVIVAIAGVATAFYIYRSYFQTVKLRYEIQYLKENTKEDPKIFR